MPERLAARLGDRVKLGVPVRRLVTRDGRVEVSGDDGVVASAARAIVALPPPLAARLVYDPALPGGRDQLTQRMALGSVVKQIAVYIHALSGASRACPAQVLADVGPAHVFFDASGPSGTPGQLMAFVEARAARELGELPESARRQVFIDCAVRVFGDAARQPVEYLDKVWADDEWSRGCYVANPAPGAWTELGRWLRAPLGPPPLGGHRDGDRVERLHRRCDPGRRAGRRGGPREAVTVTVTVTVSASASAPV